VETPATLRPPAADRRPAIDDPPGGLLFWIVVALELAAFAIIFLAVAHLRRSQGDVFRAGQAALDGRVGLALTLALVTSGWLAAEGVHAFRAGRIGRARAFHGGAVTAGLAFVALKVADYVAKGRAGAGLGVNDFWDYYLLATGFHFAHVLVGLAMLALACVKATLVGLSYMELHRAHPAHRAGFVAGAALLTALLARVA